MLYWRLVWYVYSASMHPRRWRIDMVHGEICAFSAPGLSRSRFLDAALKPAGGTTGMLYRRLTGTTARR